MQTHESLIQAATKSINALTQSFGFYPDDSLIIQWIKRDEVVLTQRCDLAVFLSPEGVSSTDLETYIEPGQIYLADQAIIFFCLKEGDSRIDSVTSQLEMAILHARISPQQTILVIGRQLFSNHCSRECDPHFTRIDMGVNRQDRANECASDPAEQIDMNIFLQRPSSDNLTTWRSVESQFVLKLLKDVNNPMTTANCARLVVAMGDIRIRDTILWDIADNVFDRKVLAETFTVLLPKLNAEFGAPIATVAAISWWLNGNGAMANLCVDRAINDDPDYSLAAMVRAALNHALPPAFWLESINDLTRAECLAGLDVAQ